MSSQNTDMTSEPSVLAIHSGALGDCLLFSHLLSALAGEVTLVSRGEVGSLLSGASVVRHYIDFDALPMQEVFADKPLADCSLRRLLGRHERLISCFGSGNVKVERRLAQMCSAQAASFLPVRMSAEIGEHLLHTWANMLGMDRELVTNPSAWPIPDAWRRSARRIVSTLGISLNSRYCVLHPGAGSPDKCWPLESYMQLADGLFPTVFVLGPAEVDRWPSKDTEKLSAQFRVIICPELETLAGLLSEAQLFIGNDSGPGHLSAAVGTPTVSLFGPTRAEQFSPVGRAVRTIAAEDMAEITVRQVHEVVAELIG